MKDQPHMTTTVENAIDYTALASDEQVLQTAAALKARGFNVEIVDTAAEALEKVRALIPAGASLMTGASQTLQNIGLEDVLISKDHPWNNLKDEILAETDTARQAELRRNSILAPYYLGSVQAISQTGEVVIASASGSQLPAYAFSSPNVIWVAGIQKIVPTLEDALRRVREYSFEQEDKKWKAMGYPGSLLAKILILEHESPRMGRNVTLILVKEQVGV
jgi:L-lactate utilization protein LutB